MKIKNFLHYARRHRIPIHPETRKIGIVCTLIGWALISFSETYRVSTENDFLFIFGLLVEFFTGTLLLCASSLFIGKYFLSIRESTEIRTEDQSQHLSHLSVPERKSLVFWRGLIAVGGYGLLNWAKSNTQIIDNSAAFSTDPIMYALLMWGVLKVKVSRNQLISLVVIFLGVCIMFSFNLLGSKELSHNNITLAVALISALSLAIVILLNTVIIQHEPPLRVAFYQCMIGFIIALVLIVLWIIVNPTNLHLIEWTKVIHSAIHGAIYAIALVFFFNAFLYTEPFLIAILGYSTFPLVAFFSWISGGEINSIDIAGAVLITLGGLASIFFQYKDDKENTQASIAGHPIYLPTLKEKFRALKQDFLAGRIGQLEYLAQRHEFNKIIFEYSKELHGTEIEKIEISKGEVFFTLNHNGFKILSNEECRSAPLEILNFGSFEKEETAFILKIINDGDTILDIGANIGWYSLQFARKFQNSIVHAFEPILQTSKILEKNIHINQIKNVVIHRIALGDIEGEIDFSYRENESTIPSKMNLFDHSKLTSTRCQITTLDLFAKQVNLNKIDFLKCHVEGSELAVIRGSLEAIRRFLPIIYIDLFHGWCEKFDYAPNDVLEILKGVGYLCFRFHEEKLQEVKIIKDTSNDFKFFFLCPQKHENLISRFI